MARERTTEAGLVVYGVNTVLELLRRGSPVTRLLLGPGPRRDELAAAARARGVAVAGTDRRALDQAAGGPHHQGVVAETPPFPYAPLATLLTADTANLLVLDGVQDPRNLGAILRTARAAGVGGVVLPQDRSVGVTSVVALTAAGLLFDLPIARVPNLVRAMGAIKEAGFWLVGLVTHGGEDLRRFTAPPRPVLVVGGEGGGLRPLVDRTCDFRVSIPMAAGVESLNVAVATGIAIFQLLQHP